MSDNTKRAPLLEASLNAILNSPNFRDYEKEMAYELLALRRAHDALVEERAGMIANAERFAFLRDWSTGRERLKILMQSVCAEDLDAAIDREIAAGKAATARYIAEQAAKGEA